MTWSQLQRFAEVRPRLCLVARQPQRHAEVVVRISIARIDRERATEVLDCCAELLLRPKSDAESAVRLRECRVDFRRTAISDGSRGNTCNQRSHPSHQMTAAHAPRAAAGGVDCGGWPQSCRR